MSADLLLRAWGDTMVTTAVLVVAVLRIRKPFVRHFGPRLTYALWAVPALRLVLPPLPFAEPVAAVPAPVAADVMLIEAADSVPAATHSDAAALAASAWSGTDMLPLLFALWAAGAAFVLLSAWSSHRRFRATVLEGAVELAPLGKIRLIMTEGVDGPVAFGLWQRFVAVPGDFFARYAAEERALAIDHELAHHRHGDLWANAAALLLLATQWFNPLAWRAIRAFRFDQEAACDARVLALVDDEAGAAPRDLRTARYATAIAKAAVGSRLSLAAPMAVHDNLQERLAMLTKQDISYKRGLIGRLLVGGAALAVLATTATLVPAGIAGASEPPADPAGAPAVPQQVDAPPAPPLPPEAPAAPATPGIMIFTERQDGSAADKDGKRREVHRIVIRRDADGDGPEAMIHAPADDKVRRLEFALPGGLSRDDIIATLKEQGIAGAQADAIADKLEAKRRQRLTTAFAPLPPMPPLPPVPPMPHGAWAPFDGKAMVIGKCGNGTNAAPIVNRDESDNGKRSRVVMVACKDGPEGRAARLAALRKAREAFVEGERARNLSDEMRAKVAADLDKAIADIEKSDRK